MTWLRVEGSTRDPDVAAGLSAEIADPLWLLARQWQVGEFHGEDAASPVMVTGRVAVTPLTGFAPGNAATSSGRGAGRPIEVLVEQEAVGDDVRLALELGWVLLRSLAARGGRTELRALLRQRFPATLPADDGLDPDGRVALDLLARRSFDGLALADTVRDIGGPRDFVAGLPSGMRSPALATAIAVWLDAVDDFVRLPEQQSSSWRDADLEYQFRVAAPLDGKQPAANELGFAASEFGGGRLDWYHFRRESEQAPLGTTGEANTRRITVLPTGLNFSGIPASRFWEIEDHAVSFGDLVGGPEDIARAVVGAFAAVYRDDWLSVPCRVPTGSVARVEQLTVFDDYGHEHDIRSVAANDGPGRLWKFFELEGDDGPNAIDRRARRSPLLMIAPTLADVEQGRPLERVDLRRDEIANLVWGIERRAVGASGRSIDRAALSPPPADRPPEAAEWGFEAFHPVPEHWIPFVPAIDGDPAAEPAQTFLRRGRMAATDPDVPDERLLPMGRVLDASRPMRVHEEAVPDAGLRIDRRYQRTRSSDGRIHLWMGRRVRYGARRQRGKVLNDVLKRPRDDAS